MADFDTEPRQVITLDDAHRLISGRAAPTVARVFRKFSWRRLMRLPARRPSVVAAVLFAASLAVPRESIFSTLLLAAAAAFAAAAFGRLKRGRHG